MAASRSWCSVGRELIFSLSASISASVIIGSLLCAKERLKDAGRTAQSVYSSTPAEANPGIAFPDPGARFSLREARCCGAGAKTLSLVSLGTPLDRGPVTEQVRVATSFCPRPARGERCPAHDRERDRDGEGGPEAHVRCGPGPSLDPPLEGPLG